MARRPRIQQEAIEGGAKPPSEAYPVAIRLTAPHGFIEDVHDKGVFHWEAGEVVTKPATIALIIERGASWEDVGCQDQSAIPPTH